MFIFHRTSAPCAASSRWHVPYMNILEVEITFEYIQEERNTPLVESKNQQHIYIYGSSLMSISRHPNTSYALIGGSVHPMK